MEENIVLFVCKALISSEKQINTHDKLYDKNFGGSLGTHIKLIAEDIEESLISHKIQTNSFCTLMNDLIYICHQTNFTISNVLKVFFENLSLHFESLYGKDVKSNNLKSMDRSPVLKAIKHDDVIEIDDDADDTNLKYTLPDGDIFYLTEYWTSLLKQVLSEIKSKSTFKLSGSITKEIYNSCIFYGFFECLDYGLNVAGKNSNILLVTEAIENLSKSTLKDSEKNETNIFFNAENFPNPIIQVLATSFRAIVEAYKISRQNNYPQ